MNLRFEKEPFGASTISRNLNCYDCYRENNPKARMSPCYDP